VAIDSSLEIEAEASRDRSGDLGKEWNYSAAVKDLVNSIERDPTGSSGDQQFHGRILTGVV
jgi:hypothetical protein